MQELDHFQSDLENTPYSLYVVLKTGGGTKRLGLGRGIHWHIENRIQYLPTDPEEQEIPFVRVTNDDGSTTGWREFPSPEDAVRNGQPVSGERLHQIKQAARDAEKEN